jgi:cytochrome P450
LTKSIGSLVRIGPNWVVCGDPIEIQRIWSIRSGFARTPWYKATRLDPEEDNVLTELDTKRHHQRRAKLVPAYAAKGLDNQEQLVDEQIEKLIDLIKRNYLSTESDVKPCNLGRVMQYLTQDIISAVGFGKPAGYLDANEDMMGILETCENLLAPGHIIMFLPLVRRHPLWRVESSRQRHAAELCRFWAEPSASRSRVTCHIVWWHGLDFYRPSYDHLLPLHEYGGVPQVTGRD